MSKIFVNDPEKFLELLRQKTGKTIPRPTNLGQDECPICRALGIDAAKKSVTRFHGREILTVPVPSGSRLPLRRRGRR